MSKIKGSIGTLRLHSGHSVVVSHIPDKVQLETLGKIASNEKRANASFGLFDTATPNYQTYYPDVTADDIKPNDDQYIKPVYRLLSAVVVHKNSNPIDFSKPGVLKASMPLLLGQTVYPDHEPSIGNALGVVSEVSWQDGYELEGVQVPAGIIGTLKIDAKSHPAVARNIMMDPPAIHSNSVTVQFNWEPSHPEMETDDFWDKLGSYDQEGQLIRRIVTKVLRYTETSLVPHGADPFAKILDDNGNMVLPKYAESVYNLSERTPQDKRKRVMFFMDFKDIIYARYFHI